MGGAQVFEAAGLRIVIVRDVKMEVGVHDRIVPMLRVLVLMHFFKSGSLLFRHRLLAFWLSLML
jgi:hypothetical protein